MITVVLLSGLVVVLGASGMAHSPTFARVRLIREIRVNLNLSAWAAAAAVRTLWTVEVVATALLGAALLTNLAVDAKWTATLTRLGSAVAFGLLFVLLIYVVASSRRARGRMCQCGVGDVTVGSVAIVRNLGFVFAAGYLLAAPGAEFATEGASAVEVHAALVSSGVVLAVVWLVGMQVLDQMINNNVRV